MTKKIEIEIKEDKRQTLLIKISNGLDVLLLIVFLMLSVTINKALGVKTNVNNLLSSAALGSVLYILWNAVELYFYKLKEIDNAIEDINDN